MSATTAGWYGRKRTRQGLLILCFLLLIPATWDYLEFLLRKRSPVLRISMTWIYGCYLLFVVNFTIQAAVRLWRLFTPDWGKQI